MHQPSARTPHRGRTWSRSARRERQSCRVSRSWSQSRGSPASSSTATSRVASRGSTAASPATNNTHSSEVNILSPRVVYCSIINLLWSFIVKGEYDVSNRHLRVLFTYWCHVCCLRFRRDNLVVDGRQMVSLVSVHGRGSLFDVYSLFHFSLAPVGFTGTLVFFMDPECPVVRQWSPTPVGLSRFVCSLNLWLRLSWFHLCMCGCCRCCTHHRQLSSKINYTTVNTHSDRKNRLHSGKGLQPCYCVSSINMFFNQSSILIHKETNEKGTNIVVRIRSNKYHTVPFKIFEKQKYVIHSNKRTNTKPI